MDVDERRVEKTINSISNETNNWIAFGRLAHELGDASFKDAIRRALNVPDRIDVPSTYTNLWRLKIRGMLNLNLDRLATRAFCEVTYENENNCKVNPNEFHGIRAKSLAHVLSNPKPFIANLHGVADESASWVLTYESLKQLTNDDGYKAFIQTCILSNTVLFVGISADDQAAGGYLEKLVNMDVDIGVNYWITDRIDIATDKWAEKNGIRIIRYKSHDSEHGDLDELFSDLLSYIPTDEIINKPVIFSSKDKYNPDDLPEVSDIMTLGSNDIRDLLNSHASRLLSNNDVNSYDKYNDFCIKYDEAIYRAWYTSLSPGNNKLFDYTLVEELGRGAFGKIYKVYSDSIHLTPPSPAG